MRMSNLRKPGWVFAWLPVVTFDTDEIVWLERVYRNWTSEGEAMYFDKEPSR